MKNEFYDLRKAQKLFNVPLAYKFFEFYTKGWFRPDYKPKGFEICYPKIFEQLKKHIYKTTRRKSAIAIYKDWFYFEDYHIKTISRLKKRIQTEVI